MMDNNTINNRAVIYARFSSNNQREESIDAQVLECTKFADDNGYMVIDQYCDYAKSGTTSDREQFLQMIDDSKTDKFDIIIVHKLDRFSRNKMDSVIYRKKLLDNDVTLISALEKLDGSPESKILESVLEGMSEFYSANLAREVMKGLKTNAKNCMHTGGFAPLGYKIDRDTKKYLIDDDEAFIVRKIFDMYTNYSSYNDILKYLNNHSCKTRTGKSFSKSSINNILKNEKYRGIFVYNRKQERTISRKRKPKLKPSSEIIRIEDGMPQIIDDVTFFRAQELLSNNKLTGGRYNCKRMYLLSGIIRCGSCGSSYCGNSRTGGNTDKMYSSYRCSSRQNKGKVDCDCKEIRKELIENFVLDELNNILFNDNTLEQITSMFNTHIEMKNNDRKKEHLSYSKNIARIDNQIKELLELVASKKVTFDTIAYSLDSFNKQKASIEQQIKDIEIVDMTAIVTNQKIHELVDMSKEFLQTKNIAECRKFINSYVDEVVVYTDKVDVIFKISQYDEQTDTISAVKSSIELKELHTRYRGKINSVTK